jgi:hypothetical protein
MTSDNWQAKSWNWHIYKTSIYIYICLIFDTPSRQFIPGLELWHFSDISLYIFIY